MVGTLDYQAPEITGSSAYTSKIDVWALGVIIYELFSGKEHKYGEKFEALPESVPEDISAILSIMLEPNY